MEMLLKTRDQYPVALHGVSLSIGSDSGVKEDYLAKLKKLIERVDPIIVSDHLCWSQGPFGNSHDLLPLPFTKEALNRVLENIDIVQTFLERPILLENISYYLRYKESEIEESKFIVDVCQKSGCKLLLDLNNIFVNSENHGFDPISFVDSIPVEIIGQMHLAGPSQEKGFLFDTHSSIVPDPVWTLLERVTERGVRAPIILEWDQDIPEFSLLESEVKKARKIRTKGVQGDHARPTP